MSKHRKSDESRNNDISLFVDHQTAAFHVQDFHAGTWAVDKDIHVTVLNVAAHSTQGVKTPAPISGVRIEVISHGRCEAEHATGALKPTATLTSAHLANC